MLVKTMTHVEISLLMEQAISAHRTGELDLAKSIYSEILAHNKKHYDAMHMLGILLFQKGQFINAHEQLSEALKINSQDPRIFYNLGLVQYELGFYQEASHFYLKSIIN